MLNLKTHVLRFWETEFPQLEPLRTESGQRLYTEENVALLKRIQQLLREQGMTIEGAKRALSGRVVSAGICRDDIGSEYDREFMGSICRELEAICQILRRPT